MKAMSYYTSNVRGGHGTVAASMDQFNLSEEDLDEKLSTIKGNK